MTPKSIWFNLPVEDVARSRAFYEALGFLLNPQFNNSDHGTSFVIGDAKVVMMIWPEATFQGYINHGLADTSQGNEVLYSYSPATKAEVDAIAAAVGPAGGELYAAPELIQGFMYGCGFADPDGHRWNPVFIDHAKLAELRGA